MLDITEALYPNFHVSKELRWKTYGTLVLIEKTRARAPSAMLLPGFEPCPCPPSLALPGHPYSSS